jgi:hypothetical protein
MVRSVTLSLGVLALLGVGETRALAQTGAQAGAGGAGVRVVITGTIRNFAEIEKLIVPESFVQLVPLTADGSFSINTDQKGQFAYVSDLPKAAAPEKAAFSFVMPNVPPGKYQLAAQRLRVQGDMAGQRPWFAADLKKTLVVDVPATAEETLDVKVGKVVVWTQ